MVALRWGPEGIAAAWSLSYWLLIIPAFWYAGQPIGMEISVLISAVWKYALASLVSAAACAALTSRFIPSPAKLSVAAAVEHMAVASGLFLTMYLSAVILLHRGCAPLRQLVNLLRELAPKGRPAWPAPAGVAPSN